MLKAQVQKALNFEHVPCPQKEEMAMTAIINVKDVHKRYESSERSVSVLNGVTFSLEAGATASIIGPSGSGKTTLLSLCAGLDAPSEGVVELLGHNLAEMEENERSGLRNQYLGFIFQSFHLMSSLTALENVLLPVELAGKSMLPQAREMLARVGLEHRMTHYPAQLSGGEQQRVAIARAFINQPRMLFADEPTGNLDRETCAKVVDLIFDLNRELGTTLLLITHDQSLAERTQRQFFLDNGRIFEKTVAPANEEAPVEA
jgi:putative ABC transport system ATP-binding protein